MPKYIASRLAGGNRLFPAEIVIDNIGVTIKVPGLFGGRERTIPFKQISAVDIKCPMVGFSSILIKTISEGFIFSNGFTKPEVQKMRDLIMGQL